MATKKTTIKKATKVVGKEDKKIVEAVKKGVSKVKNKVNEMKKGKKKNVVDVVNKDTKQIFYIKKG